VTGGAGTAEVPEVADRGDPPSGARGDGDDGDGRVAATDSMPPN
jgi:hypothetical protein